MCRDAFETRSDGGGSSASEDESDAAAAACDNDDDDDMEEAEEEDPVDPNLRVMKAKARTRVHHTRES